MWIWVFAGVLLLGLMAFLAVGKTLVDVPENGN